MQGRHVCHGTDYCLGIDIGSISADFALMSKDREIVRTSYHRIKGQPIHKTLDVLKTEFYDLLGGKAICLAFTGSGGKILSQITSGSFMNEILAQMRAVTHLYPQAKTIIEIGGEDSKLILLDSHAQSCPDFIGLKDFAMNTMCAAGTGSFLDQQASRLGVSIEEEFGCLAMKSKNPARIAGRCSVFAKSDMIHLQQEATPDYDIIAGLCFAVARNFTGTICKGKQLQRPLVFQGGVAANLGMRRAFEEILDLKPGELIIPTFYNCMGAIGAALISLQKPQPVHFLEAVKKIEEYLGHHTSRSSSLPPLKPFNLQLASYQKSADGGKGNGSEGSRRPVQGFLGIDVGSISTNLVVIDDERRVISKRYLMTAGRPIEAVRQGLEEIGQEIGDKIDICGVGTTGSGRYLIGDFVGADIVKNEITAQAKASHAIDPRVDTIFEIGGQDSKYISLDQATVVDFEMNKVCAAGTGSFLEEQAEKLEINIKGEFETLALSASCPATLGERCTVFIESDLVTHQQDGASKQDLVGGLCYSIVHNYLNRVVAGRRVGNHIFFQGGVAANKGVVAAFEKVIKKPVIVPEHHEVTGAIGVALLALEEKKWSRTKFKGFGLSKRPYEVECFECKGCPNYCQIKKVTVDQDRPLFYGSRCEKYDEKKREQSQLTVPDLFTFRSQELHKSYIPSTQISSRPGKRVGIPLCLFFHELLPFWRTFFEALGFEVVLSLATNKEIIAQGVQASIAETCFPVKVSYGHILNLVQKKVDYIFLPSIINMPSHHHEKRNSFNCPYVQTIPYTVSAALDIKKMGPSLLKPVIYLQGDVHRLKKCFIDFGRSLGQSAADSVNAFRLAKEAQSLFYATLQEEGDKILKSHRWSGKTLVLISRPYNGFDYGINLEIPKIFQEMGLLIVPIDFLSLDQFSSSDEWPNMYWRYGQRILSAARFIRQMPDYYAVYLTNFGCGPDSFITQFFQSIMKGKPYLQIEVDEHSGRAGIITRCEAFIDSLNMIHGRTAVTVVQSSLNLSTRKLKEKGLSAGLADTSGHTAGRSENCTLRRNPLYRPEFTLYIPHMSEHAHALCSAFRSQGVKAEVMPESDDETISLGRMHTSGKECYPCLITTGDMIKVTRSAGFHPHGSAFFMPSGDGPCRFGQYNRFHRMVLDNLGFENVPIFAPNQGEDFYRELGIVSKQFSYLAWQGVVMVDFLDKWLFKSRPYEKNPGQADHMYQECLSMLCRHIERGQSAFSALEGMKRILTGLELKPEHDRPIIGIVGEIFVRSHCFSNNHLIRDIEQLGGEVRLAPVTEWFHYINYTAKVRSLSRRNWRSLLSTIVNDLFQKRFERKVYHALSTLVPHGKEPSMRSLLHHSCPYLDPSFEGEAILSIGKSIDFLSKEISGIINVMPFTCMPGTISTGILKKVRQDFGDFPFLHLTYDGLEDTTVKTRLEAFLYQARRFKHKTLPRIDDLCLDDAIPVITAS
ncbi:MAG: acyl-CoA dehydratase activase [bacterium]